MARPFKQGLEYFALDVNMSDEVELIEAVHGLVGFAVLIKLFQKIYSEGYFIEWQEKDQILFSNRVSDDRNRVTSIVSDCIKWGIFNSDMYRQYGILTSRRIQEQYFMATYKRVKVTAIREYLIIDVDDRDHVSIIGVSDIRNGATTKVSDDSNGATSRVSVVQSTQSKVKQSKEKVKDKDLIESDATKTSKPDTLHDSLHDTSRERGKSDATKTSKVTQSKTFIELPLNDGSCHGVTFEDLDKYKELYLAVNVEQELRAMVGWLDANPARRKTRRGVKSFITGWLNRSQDSGKGYNQRGQSQPERERIKDDSEYEHETNAQNSPYFQAWYAEEQAKRARETREVTA